MSDLKEILERERCTRELEEVDKIYGGKLAPDLLSGRYVRDVVKNNEPSETMRDEEGILEFYKGPLKAEKWSGVGELILYDIKARVRSTKGGKVYKNWEMGAGIRILDAGTSDQTLNIYDILKSRNKKSEFESPHVDPVGLHSHKMKRPYMEITYDKKTDKSLEIFDLDVEKVNKSGLEEEELYDFVLSLLDLSRECGVGLKFPLAITELDHLKAPAENCFFEFNFGEGITDREFEKAKVPLTSKVTKIYEEGKGKWGSAFEARHFKKGRGRDIPEYCFGEGWSLEGIQGVVESWVKNHGSLMPLDKTFLLGVEETGEISTEILNLSGDLGKKERKNIDIGEELGDLSFVTIQLANKANIELGKSLQNVLLKYHLRDVVMNDRHGNIREEHSLYDYLK